MVISMCKSLQFSQGLIFMVSSLILRDMEELLTSALEFISTRPSLGAYFLYRIHDDGEDVKLCILAFDEGGCILGGSKTPPHVSSWYFRRCGDARRELLTRGGIRQFFARIGHPMEHDAPFFPVRDTGIFKANPSKFYKKMCKMFA